MFPPVDHVGGNDDVAGIGSGIGVGVVELAVVANLILAVVLDLIGD